MVDGRTLSLARNTRYVWAASFGLVRTNTVWLIWIGANATTALYSWLRVNDAALAGISAFNAACCALVLLLAMYKRAAHISARAPRSYAERAAHPCT